jgi:predicted nuclease of predicted toxin-antitoxin system
VKGLLIDENLPAGLAIVLGENCKHASDIATQPSDDALWNYARENDRVILTKDADFFDKLMIEGPPPKVVWLRNGNLKRADLEALLSQAWPKIRELLARADLIEVHRDRLESMAF